MDRWHNFTTKINWFLLGRGYGGVRDYYYFRDSGGSNPHPMIFISVVYGSWRTDTVSGYRSVQVHHKIHFTLELGRYRSFRCSASVAGLGGFGSSIYHHNQVLLRERLGFSFFNVPFVDFIMDTISGLDGRIIRVWVPTVNRGVGIGGHNLIVRHSQKLRVVFLFWVTSNFSFKHLINRYTFTVLDDVLTRVRYHGLVQVRDVDVHCVFSFV